MSTTRILILHTGALGDHIMIWPLIRAMTSAGCAVMLACESGKGRLAREVLGIETCGIERGVFLSLWMEETRGDERDGGQERGALELVVSFLTEETDAAGRVWAMNARRVFAPAVVECIGAPGSASRARLWERWEVGARGRVAERVSLTGPVVMHIGSGGRTKMWNMERWRALAGHLRDQGHEVVALAGEVERERLTQHERMIFAEMRGRWVDELGELVEIVRGARVFIGADTGPTHLAAQLGVHTLALFGPTDPAVWRPVGPQVRVLAPETPMPMDWLRPEDVLSGLVSLPTRDSG